MSARDLEKIFGAAQNIIDILLRYYTGERKLKQNQESHIDDVNSIIQSICNDIHNVHFLNRSTVEICGVLFIGCTLWSLCPLKSDSTIQINDLYRIPAMTQHRYRELHIRDRDWLSEILCCMIRFPCVVVTHHLPSFDLIHKDFSDSILNTFFASKCDDLVRKSDLWIAGHTHRSMDKLIGRTRVMVNPVGYPHEKGTNFNQHLSISI
jgi:Icc-related predicted phosphoesterase